MQNQQIHSDQADKIKERQKDECVISIKDKLQSHDEQTHSEQLDKVIARREKLQQAKIDDDTASWRKHCIYRVLGDLKKYDYKLYIPQTVSLGPYHHAKKHLQSMEDYKWRAVNKVLRRNKQEDIEMYMDKLTELEGQVRASYHGQIDMDSDEFRQMLVVDGLFVLELFMGNLQGFQKMGYEPTDPVFGIRGSIPSIRLDMLMLENQLPLFLLKRLLSLQLSEISEPHTQTGGMEKLIFQFFKPLMPSTFKKTNPCKSKLTYSFEKHIDSSEEALHCLDVFRRSLLQYTANLAFSPTSVVDKSQYRNVPCVMELKSAGIKFIKKKKIDRFWDIKFEKRHLEIPEIPNLLIEDGPTKSLALLSNLIAFEQYHRGLTNALTSYVMFMENLISSPEDVKHLQDRGIIERRIGSESDVSDLFKQVKQLRKKAGLNLQESYLSQTTNKVEGYLKKNALKVKLRHKFLDTLRQRYFHNPWAYLSFFAAVLLLIFTLIQTFFTVYAYYHPRF